MQLKSALVAIICSAILSAGLAIGLGSDGSQATAAGGSVSSQLKAISSQLKAIKKTLGSPDTPVGRVDVIALLQTICENTRKDDFPLFECENNFTRR